MSPRRIAWALLTMIGAGLVLSIFLAILVALFFNASTDLTTAATFSLATAIVLTAVYLYAFPALAIPYIIFARRQQNVRLKGTASAVFAGLLFPLTLLAMLTAVWFANLGVNIARLPEHLSGVVILNLIALLPGLLVSLGGLAYERRRRPRHRSSTFPQRQSYLPPGPLP